MKLNPDKIIAITGSIGGAAMLFMALFSAYYLVFDEDGRKVIAMVHPVVQQVAK